MLSSWEGSGERTSQEARAGSTRSGADAGEVTALRKGERESHIFTTLNKPTRC